MLHDLRYAVRMLLKSPGFAIVAVLTLAMGIGANTAIFSVVRAVLLRPLPYPAPDRLVRAVITENKRGTFPGSRNDYLTWRDQSRAFTSLAALDYGSDYTLTGAGEPERLAGNRVTPNFFSVFGVAPALGRTFTPGGERSGAPPVVVLSDGLWRSRFNADPNIVGRTLTLNSTAFTVIGVMPEEFKFPPSAQLWTPLDVDKDDLGGRWLDVVGRLRAGITVSQAQAEMDTVASRLTQSRTWNPNVGISLIGMQESMVGDVRPVLLQLLIAVGFVLLVACVNVANLLLTRATGRAREIAIRSALGAARRHVIRQVLTESLLLALLGGLGGVMLALWGVDALPALQPGKIPRLSEVRLDLPVLGFALGISVVSGILFGLMPAFNASRLSLNEYIKDAAHGSAGDRTSRTRSALVVAEIALTLVLVTATGLMLRSFVNALAVRPGFDPRGVTSAAMSLPPARYNREQALGFYRQLLERLQTQPGVQAASLTNFTMPMDPGPGSARFSAEGCPYKAGGGPLATMRTVMPDYFRTLGVPLLRGRDFSGQDFLSRKPILIINESLARLCWHGQNPVGGTFEFGNTRAEVVGVVGDMREYSAYWEPLPGVYFPGLSLSSTLVLRTAPGASGVAGMIRREVQALDKELPLYDVKTADQILAASVQTLRFNTLMLSMLSGLVLLLTGIGVCGVVAYGVSRRTHEFGIRMALGASTANVRVMVLRQALWLAVAGVTVGLAGALAVTRLMKGMLFGVSATDPLTFTAVAVGLVAVALLACYLPARRATKVDPMIALRCE